MTISIPRPPAKRPNRSRRLPRCEGCGLATAMCLCSALPRLAVRARVILLMHHVEAFRGSNTGRLAIRMLEGSELRMRGGKGEIHPTPPAPEGRRLLLFPTADARVLSPADAGGAPVVLIVPDGSWRQARKVCHREPLARDAEPVTLPPGDASRYTLRATSRDGAVCTFEAIARAMAILEGPEVERQMTPVLDEFLRRFDETRRGLVTGA